MSSASAKERPKGQGPPRVVILGGGYGGIYTALGLEKAARRGEIEVSLVSRENFFLYQPMLAEVVSGSIEPPHIVNPIRRMLRYTDFYLAEIEGVDAQKREVVVRYPGGHAHYERIPYDHLVVAVGSATDLSRMPGMTEHAFPFKTLGDAFSLRNHLISVMERAEVENVPEELTELLTFVVVGGGYTGVEVAAEINAFVREAAKSYRRVDPEDVRVILLEGASRILPELNEAQAAFSQRQLEGKGIEVRLDTLIQEATAQTAILGDGVEIPTRTLVAAVGSAPNRLLDTVPGGRDPRGRLEVNETLAVPDQPGIWAVGDCAAVPDLRKGGTCPPTAQYALRQARQLARNIRTSIRGEAPRPFSYRSLGVFVPLGRFSAAADVMGLKISGFFAWWLYRTYYLSQLPRLERKLRVVFDWTMELLFRRDIVKMDVGRSDGVTRAHYQPSEVIFREGGLAGNFYVVLDGKVQIFRQQNGHDEEERTLGPGDFFGERSLLRGAQHSASARAETQVDLLIMNGADFTALATSSTRFGALLDDVMQQRKSGSEATDISPGDRQGDNEGAVSNNR